MFGARALLTIWEELELCGANPRIVGWIMFPLKKLYWNLNPWCLRMWFYLEMEWLKSS